jgi:hypothetical protein
MYLPPDSFINSGYFFSKKDFKSCLNFSGAPAIFWSYIFLYFDLLFSINELKSFNAFSFLELKTSLFLLLSFKKSGCFVISVF